MFLSEMPLKLIAKISSIRKGAGDLFVPSDRLNIHKGRSGMRKTKFRKSLLALLVGATVVPSVIAGPQRVGSWEYNIDVPWRISPTMGGVQQSNIPVNISIFDAGISPYTPEECDVEDDEISDCDNSPPERIHRITITEYDSSGVKRGSRHYKGFLPLDDIAYPPEVQGKLVSVEKTVGYWLKDKLVEPNTNQDNWQGAADGEQLLCLESSDDYSKQCTADKKPFDEISKTSEWHAVLSYEPFQKTPGSIITLVVTTDGLNHKGKRQKIRSKIITTLAKAPLPKFGDDYAYGDLHYHSQGTDNAGEVGYSYRESFYAANAIGLDFLLFSDHANNVAQPNFFQVEYLSKATFNALISILALPITQTIGLGIDLAGFSDQQSFWVQSDMGPNRWNNHWGIINSGPNSNGGMGPGINYTNEGAFSGVEQHKGSGYLHAANLVLGGEIDFIPEVRNTGSDLTNLITGTVGRHHYKVHNSCSMDELPGGGFGNAALTGSLVDRYMDLKYMFRDGSDWVVTNDHLIATHVCKPRDVFDPVTDPDGEQWLLLRDVQPVGYGLGYSRQHMLFLPEDPTDSHAGIISNTNQAGGATLRLKDIHEKMLSTNKGFGFLAHPLAKAGGSGKGRLGPDLMPLDPTQIIEAMGMNRILGFQAWNENEHFVTTTTKLNQFDYRCTYMGSTGDASVKSTHYHYHTGLDSRSVMDRYLLNGDRDSCGNYRTDDPDDAYGSYGMAAGTAFSAVFDMILSVDDSSPLVYEKKRTSRWQETVGGFELTDMANTWGLIKSNVQKWNFLSTNEPRKMFLAGGSDAHGDFSQRQEGYALGFESLNDTAMGTPRNLVYALNQVDGANGYNGPSHVGSAGVAVTYSWPSILEGLKQGNFSVTDGPAVRIAIDMNGSGLIDEGDVPMGSTLVLPATKRLQDQTIPVLVEYLSTEDFGKVSWVSLTLGGATSSDKTVRYSQSSQMSFERSFLDDNESRWGLGEGTLKSSRAIKKYNGTSYVNQFNYRQDPTPSSKLGHTPDRVFVNTSPVGASLGYSEFGGKYANTVKFNLKPSDYPYITFSYNTTVGANVLGGVSHINRMWVRAEVQTSPTCNSSKLEPCTMPRVGVTNPVWIVQDGWKN